MEDKVEPDLMAIHSAAISTEIGGLSYDDAEYDGPYKSLARSSGFVDTIGYVRLCINSRIRNIH